LPGHRRPRRPVKNRAKPPRDLSLPPEEVSFLVDGAQEGDRVDLFIMERLPWRSRAEIVRWIEDGRVLVAGERAKKKAQRLRKGNEVVCQVPRPDEPVRHDEIAASLEILYEDEHLLVVNKPAGLVMHPVGKVRVNTLIQALHWRFRHGDPREAAVVPKICHRLDKDTSGVLLVAKEDRARIKIQELFERRDVEKEYASVVAGIYAEDAGLIDAPIGPNPAGKVRMEMMVRPDGDPSRTRFQVLERFAFAPHGGASLVRFDLETGRQHQIRVHSASLGHPVFLDVIYGPWEPGARWPLEGDPCISRQALHARRLAFDHPRTGERLTLVAPIPPDVTRLIESFRVGGVVPTTTASSGSADNS
jgi:23S rRNA pseudouridine1911/1915/1917 synthase